MNFFMMVLLIIGQPGSGNSTGVHWSASPYPNVVETESYTERIFRADSGQIRLNRWEDVADSAAKILKKFGVPGAQFGVFTKDSVLLYRNYGLGMKNPAVEVSDSSVFRLGSTSKHFTGVLALMLVDEGILDLNERLSDALPEFAFYNPWEATDPVRLVHLMEHTTGFDDTHFHEYAVNDSAITLRDGLKVARYKRTSRWKPGTVSSYCNIGPPLLARVIEVKTSRRFEDLVQERIFGPAGLEMTYYLTDKIRNRMTGAHYGLKGTPTSYWHIAFRPSGAINTTGLDLMRWGQLLLNDGVKDGNQILPAGVLDRISTPVSSLAAKNGSPWGYAMGMDRSLVKGKLYIQHGGATNGHQCMLWFLPETGTGGFLLINSDQDVVGSVTAILRSFVLRNTPDPVYEPLTVEDRNALEGYYVSDFPRNAFTRGLARLTGRFRIVTENDTTRVRGLLEAKSPVFVRLNGLLMSVNDKNAAVVSTVQTSDGVTFINPAKMVLVSPIRYWGGVLLAVFVLLVLAVNFFLAAGWLLSVAFRMMSKKVQVLNTGYAIWPILAVLPFGGLMVLIGGDTAFADILAAAEFGFQTVFIFVATSLVPVFALAAVLTAWKDSPKTGMLAGIWRWVTATATLAITLFVFQFGYWAFRPWVDL